MRNTIFLGGCINDSMASAVYVGGVRGACPETRTASQEDSTTVYFATARWIQTRSWVGGSINGLNPIESRPLMTIIL